MPRLRVIAAVVQSDEALNLKGNSESTSLSYVTEPSDEILVEKTCYLLPVKIKKGKTHDSPRKE